MAASPTDAASVALAALQSEAATMRLLVFKSENQHRRAQYWRAFRRGHRAVVALLGAAGAIRRGGAGGALLRERAEAAAATLLVAARRVSARQEGGAFAGLAAVLLAATARYLELTLAVRDALPAAVVGTAGAPAAAAPRAASLGVAPAR